MTSSSLNDALSGAMAQENLRSAAQRASRENTAQSPSPAYSDQIQATQVIKTEAGQTQGHFEQQTNRSPMSHDMKQVHTSAEKNTTTAQNRNPQETEAGESEGNEKESPSLAEQLSELNNVMYALNRKIKFEVDDATEALIVRVVNKETNEIIRQYPKDEVLKRMERLLEGDTGSFSTEIE